MVILFFLCVLFSTVTLWGHISHLSNICTHRCFEPVFHLSKYILHTVYLRYGGIYSGTVLKTNGEVGYLTYGADWFYPLHLKLNLRGNSCFLI